MRFHYALHFSLLAGFSILLIALAWLHAATDLSTSFALYGALHAAALVFALCASQTLWRKCLFIVMSAALSAAILRIGLFGAQLSGAVLGSASLYGILGFSAALGAAVYGVLMHWFGVYEFTARSLALISMGCALATDAAFFTLVHCDYVGRWWLAVLWWYAFSGGLWYFDKNAARNLPEK